MGTTLKKVKTAVVGCGMISNIYIRNLKNLFSIIDLTALCDINQEAAEQKAKSYGVEKIMTLKEIAASKDIEMVVNLTGPGAHYDVIRMMLESGKHVFTEKVLTTDLEQGEELIRLADEKQCYLGVAPDTILGAGIQTAKKVIDSGLIGEITSCMASINRNQSLNSESFRFLREEGGALPYDVGIYYIAALLCLLGPVKSIRGFGAPAPEHRAELLYQEDSSFSWTIPGNNLLTGSLQFAGGALGSVHFNGNTIGEEKNFLLLYGTEGILELGDPNTFGGYVKLIRPETGECVIPHTHGYNGEPVWPDPTPYDYAYGHRGVGAAEMAWAIRMQRENRCSKELGFHAMEVLYGLDQAAEHGTTYEMTSSFHMTALKSGYLSTMGHGKMRADAERSLVD